MIEVYVSLIKYDDFALFDSGAQFPRALGVGLSRRVDDRKTRQKTLQVQPQMSLGRRLAPPVLGPVQARDDQLDGRRIHQMNGPPEPPRKLPAGFAADEPRRQVSQMLIHRPEQLLGHDGVAHPVGMGKVVARGRSRAPQGRQRSGVELEGVTDIVESDAMAHLRVAEGDDMTPLILGAGLLIDSGLVGQLGHQVG